MFRRAILTAAAFGTVAASLAGAPVLASTGPVSPSATWAVSFPNSPGNNLNWGSQPFAGAAVGDLSGNGQEDVVAAFPNGGVYAFSSGGALLPGWPKFSGKAIVGSPALADLLGDGREEVIVTSQDGFVHAYTANGSELPGWPVFGGYGNFTPGFIGGAVVGDLMGNGEEDVVAASTDHYLYAWSSSGSVLSGFPINLWDTSVNTPLLVDLNHTGKLDIVVGGDSVPGQSQTANLYAFPPTGCSSANASLSGCDLPGWPVTLHETPWSSPAAADLLASGSQEVIDGTGHYYYQTTGGADSWGDRVNGWSANGQNFDNWPQATPKPNYGSVAIGNLLGNGQLQVVAESESNQLFAYGANGTLLPGWPASTAVTDIGSPSIGPVDGSGHNGVWAPALDDVWGLNSTGSPVVQLSLQNAVQQFGLGSGSVGYVAYAAPTVAQLAPGQGLSLIETFSNMQDTDWFVAAFPIPGTTTLPVNTWPTFHGNMQRSGGQVPIATVTGTSVGSSSTTTNFQVNWATVAGSVPATRYDLWVSEPSLGWQLYTRTTQTSATFTGLPGHTYGFFVTAENGLGSAEIPKTPQATVSISGGATHSPALPFGGAYAVDMTGRVEPIASPDLVTSATFPAQNLIRGIALTAGGHGGYTVDAYGGIHAFGNAQYETVSAYFPGWDIIRGIAVLPSGSGGYTVDAYGGVHPFGNAPYLQVSAYFSGWDIVRGIVLNAAGTGGYTVDGYGGVHAFGNTPYLQVSAYFPGWDIVRGVTLDAAGTGGYTVDGYGGVHAFGSTQYLQVSAYFPGWDIVRGIAVLPGGAGGYTLDGWGGVHPFGSAPFLETPGYRQFQDIVRGIAVS
jgi:hypothetical protein